MPLTVYLAQVSIPWESGAPQDVTTNRIHVQSLDLASDPEADGLIIASALNDLFAVPFNAHPALVDFLSPCHLLDDASIAVYNLLDPTPRVPVWENTFEWGPATTQNSAPTNLTVNTTFQHLRSSGELQARMRNHMKIGPVHMAQTGAIRVVEEALGHIAIVSSELREMLVDGLSRLKSQIGAASSGNLQWVTFSPTVAGPSPYTLLDLTNASEPVQQVRVSKRFGQLQSRKPTVIEDEYTVI